MNPFRKHPNFFLLKLLFLFLLTFQAKILALYVGNPALPEILQEGLFFSKENAVAIKTAYQRDWVFNMDMKAVSSVSGQMDDFKSLSDQGVLLVNLFNHISLYGSLGAMRINTSHIPTSGIQNVYQTDNQLTWGLGLRAFFASWHSLMFGIDAKYQAANPSIKWMTQNGAPFIPKKSSKIDFSQWQIGLGMSYQIALFYPYISLKYSNAKAYFKHLPNHFFPNTNHFTIKNRKKFGIAIGTTLSNSSIFDVSVEAQLIDQEALTLTGEIRF